jgi:hypothetical protein
MPLMEALQRYMMLLAKRLPLKNLAQDMERLLKVRCLCGCEGSSVSC